MKGPALLASSVALTACLAASPASAQQWVLGGAAGLASGVAGGGPSGSAMQRARTRLRLAVDFHVDEFPKDVFAIGVLTEIEPHAGFGVDARYLRSISQRVQLNAGGIALLFPQTLLGPACGMDLRFGLGHAVSLTVGPEINVFVFGSDLVGNSIVWQALLQVGVHFDL
jgi:hypothetical protein